MAKSMQLVIPMAGASERFTRAGYREPKFLIPIQGRPMIAWVLKMFPQQKDILFLCRQEHLDTLPLAETLKSLAPAARIVAVAGHKRGPVPTILDAAKHLSDEMPVLVSYCDYYMQWDYAAFCAQAQQWDGAVPCYTGFHPHLIHPHYYAGCLADAQGFLTDIREKHCFTPDRMQGLHSAGAYYFSSGRRMKEYFARQVNEELQCNGEYYVSLAYRLMLRDGLRIGVPAIGHFCQWGTPGDLAESLFWMERVAQWQP